MPLAAHLMFKYSDVLADPTLGKGERSPVQFREQLERCGGDVPLNVFATINNRLALDKFSLGDHLEVEQVPHRPENSLRTSPAGNESKIVQ